MRKALFIMSQLSDEDVDWIAEQGERVRLPPGQELVAAGGRVDSVYFVIDGLLEVTGGGGSRLAELGSGEIVGEMSLVDPAPTAVSVRAAVSTLLLRLPNAALRAKLSADIPFAARFYRALTVFLADRMRNTTRRMGYGAEPEASGAQLDELSEDLLDNVHLAGARFDRMLKKLAG
jgi:CRP/FNR family transcriptional regulator, cyclic AMP receptor protein